MLWECGCVNGLSSMCRSEYIFCEYDFVFNQLCASIKLSLLEVATAIFTNCSIFVTPKTIVFYGYLDSGERNG